MKTRAFYTTTMIFAALFLSAFFTSCSNDDKVAEEALYTDLVHIDAPSKDPEDRKDP